MHKEHWVDEYANFKLKWKAEAWIVLNHLHIFWNMKKEHQPHDSGEMSFWGACILLSQVRYTNTSSYSTC